jgi:hypothetical protein
MNHSFSAHLIPSDLGGGGKELTTDIENNFILFYGPPITFKFVGLTAHPFELFSVMVNSTDSHS